MPKFISRRLVEWSVMGMLFVAMVLSFLHQSRVMQWQAELVAVKTTLGALRTAFIIDDLQRRTAQNTQSVVTVQRNPFYLLQSRPGNYWGEISQRDVNAVPPGNWVFDTVCVCVGYLPLNATAFDSPSVEGMAWYKVEGTDGPLQLTVKVPYVWQGELLN